MRFRRDHQSLIDPLASQLWESAHDVEAREESRPPAHEVIEWHLTYAAEAYLPSHAERLQEALKEQGWTSSWSPPPPDLVHSLRRSAFGGAWTNLGVVFPPGHTYWGDVKEGALPDGVASVQLALWSVTPSLTVLVSVFEWDSEQAESLDRLAKSDFSRINLPMAGRRRQIVDPFAHKRMEIDRRRRELRRRVGGWLAERAPGAFTDLGQPLPALDVLTTALARPFEDIPSQTGWYDYRVALSLDAPFQVGLSPSLPHWRLAFPDGGRDEHVLTLAARTIDAFDCLEREGGYEVNRFGLSSYLRYRVDDLVCGWAAMNLIGALRAELSRARDRGPAENEGSGAFARRLSRDVDQVLRRGADASAFCAEVLHRPEELGPLRVFRGLDFTLEAQVGRKVDLSNDWPRWLSDQARVVERLEQDLQRRVSTAAQLSGLVVSIRVQDQMRLLTLAAVVFAIAALVVGILQL